MTLPESYSQVLVKEMLKVQNVGILECSLSSIMNVLPMMTVNILCETLNSLILNPSFKKTKVRKKKSKNKISNDFIGMLLNVGDSRTFGNHPGWNKLKNQFLSK
jgi:hypothetical protein